MLNLTLLPALMVFRSALFSRITLLGEKRVGLYASRAFVCLYVAFCLSSLPLSVRDWLRLVIVALPGPFT